MTHDEIEPVAAAHDRPGMTSVTTLTVATANTCTGDLLRTTGGLEPFRTARAGIVGLQEVFGITEPELRVALGGAGLALTHWHAAAGLVLADDPRVASPVGDPIVTTLKEAGPLLRISNHWHERAMLSAAFETVAGLVTVRRRTSSSSPGCTPGADRCGRCARPSSTTRCGEGPTC